MRALLLPLLALLQGGGAARPASAPSPFERPPVDQDLGLVTKINESIRRAEEWLLATQGERGSWNREEHGARIGYTELVLYALASSGEGSGGAPEKPAPAAIRAPMRPRIEACPRSGV